MPDRITEYEIGTIYRWLFSPTPREPFEPVSDISRRGHQHCGICPHEDPTAICQASCEAVRIAREQEDGVKVS